MIQVSFPLSQRQVAQARHITGGEESLGRGSGFGPLLLPLSSSDRKVRGLCSIVLPKAVRIACLSQRPGPAQERGVEEHTLLRLSACGTDSVSGPRRRALHMGVQPVDHLPQGVADRLASAVSMRLVRQDDITGSRSTPPQRRIETF